MKNKYNWGLISSYRQEIMGVACLWTILHHNIFDWPTVLEAIRILGVYGNAGVDIFLFLSGVSLYFSFQKKPTIKEFYLRRITRLLIPFILLAAPYWIWKDVFLNMGNFFLDLTMLSFPLQHVITTWYVGAILFFYIMYPFIYKIYFKTDKIFGITIKNKNIIAILLPSAVAVICFVLMSICPGIYNNIEIGLTRTVIFLIGCKAGQLVYEKKILYSELVWISGIFLIFYSLFFRTTISLNDYWIRLSYVAVAISAVLLLSVLFDRVSWHKIKRILVYFGSRSLEIYLAHVLIKNVYLYYFPDTIFDRWRILDYAIIVGIALVVGEIVHRISKRISRVILKEK